MTRGALALAFLFASTLAGAARAEDQGRPASCRGLHGLWSPLPDECLEVIDTDRPHQTDTPHVVPAGHTQIESALGEVELGGVLGAPKGQRSAKIVLLDDGYKFGLVTGVDLQLILAHALYDTGAARFEPPGPMNVRAKLRLVEGGGWIPAITLVPSLFAPFAPTEDLRAGPLVFWGWELPLHLELEVNTGVLFTPQAKLAPEKPPVALVLASALTYTVVGELRVFIDAYATGWDIALGTGALLAVSRDAQIDLGTYIGLDGDEPHATPFLGLSVRR